MEEGPENSAINLMGNQKKTLTDEPQSSDPQQIKVHRYGDARNKTTVGFEKANW